MSDDPKQNNDNNQQHTRGRQLGESLNKSKHARVLNFGAGNTPNERSTDVPTPSSAPKNQYLSSVLKKVEKDKGFQLPKKIDNPKTINASWIHHALFSQRTSNSCAAEVKQNFNIYRKQGF